MKRQATGQGTSWLWLNNRGATDRARASASDSLDHKLRNENDAVSCPDCGLYQKDMVDRLKRRAWRAAGNVAFSFGVIGGILALIGAFLLAVAPGWLKLTLSSVLVVVWVWAVLRMVIRAYELDPNARADKRRGRTFSADYPVLRRAEFDEIQEH